MNASVGKWVRGLEPFRFFNGIVNSANLNGCVCLCGDQKRAREKQTHLCRMPEQLFDRGRLTHLNGVVIDQLLGHDALQLLLAGRGERCIRAQLLALVQTQFQKFGKLRENCGRDKHARSTSLAYTRCAR